jgi:putative copper resistance protein D
VVELVLLAATFGASVGLTDLPPPAFLGRLVTGDETLLGYHLHGAPDLARLALDWRVEVFFAPLCVVLAVSYLWGVRRLRRAGTVWPVGRTVSWLAGCLLLLVLTSSGLGRYAPAMFSIQAAVHMLMGMVAPLLFALGGPLSLARDALPPAPDGELPGPREWLEALRTSAVVRVFTQPLVCVVVFAGAPFLLYFTDAFDVTVRFHWAHLAMDVVFLVVGYLFAWVVVGVDPLPRPMPNLLRLGMLLAAMPFDLVFGAAVIGSHRILGDGSAGANLYTALALPWVHSLSADQRLGGVLSLGFGEAAFLATLAVLVLWWHRAENGGDAGDGYQDLLRALAARTSGAPSPEPEPLAKAGPLPAEAAQPQAVGHHQQRRDGHGSTGDQRVE